MDITITNYDNIVINTSKTQQSRVCNAPVTKKFFDLDSSPQSRSAQLNTLTTPNSLEPQ